LFPATVIDEQPRTDGRHGRAGHGQRPTATRCARSLGRVLDPPPLGSPILSVQPQLSHPPHPSRQAVNLIRLDDDGSIEHQFILDGSRTPRAFQRDCYRETHVSDPAMCPACSGTGGAGAHGSVVKGDRSRNRRIVPSVPPAGVAVRS
jgi:hypothetical protein